MLKKEMQDAINAQINEELYSSYLYAAMVNYFEQANLKGMAAWMRIQVQEELMHASKMFKFVLDRGGEVSLAAIKAPTAKWASPLAAWKAAYKHECHISECINTLYSKAAACKDPASTIFYEWFVTEQVEEEANVSDIVAQMTLIEGAPGGLFLLDRELGARTLPAAGTTAT